MFDLVGKLSPRTGLRGWGNKMETEQDLAAAVEVSLAHLSSRMDSVVHTHTHIIPTYTH